MFNDIAGLFLPFTFYTCEYLARRQCRVTTRLDTAELRSRLRGSFVVAEERPLRSGT
jgi:hypothetical protein